MFYAFLSSNIEVQCPQRVASIGISYLQYGQIFVVFSSTSGFLPNDIALLMAFMIQNRINALIKKFTTALKKLEATPPTSCRD